MKVGTHFFWFWPLLIATSFLALLVVAFGQSTLAQVPANNVSHSSSDVSALGFDEAEPLPGGCITGLPPGGDEPICCLSGYVYVDGAPVKDAEVKILDAQGEIGKVYTSVKDELHPSPSYYVDLTSLARPVVPTSVITLVASYNGITSAKVYTVKPGGQNFHFNLYNVNALVANNTVEGEADAGKFFYTGDLATDSQGNVYVVDQLNYRVQVFDPNGNLLRVWGGRSLLPGQWSGISGITIDQRTDAVYLVQQGWMGKFTTDGDLVNVWRAPAANPYIFSRPGDIEVDGQGNLFVADYHPGVNKFDANGNWIPWSGWNQQLNSFFMSAIALSPVAPFIFATNYRNYNIYRIGDDGFPITQTVLSQTGVITFDRPTGIAFDADGFLYISDCDTSVRVRKFAVSANNILQEQPFAWERQPGYCSTRMVFHGNYLYLGAYADQFIYQYKRDGSFVRKWGGLATNPSQVAEPRGLAISPVTNELYGVDGATRRIFKLQEGKIVNSWSAQDLGISVLVPTGITFDRAGKMYVTTNDAIVKLSIVGNQLITETIAGSLSGGETNELRSPTALAVDQNNNVFVSDYLHDRVAIVRLENNTMQTMAVMAGVSRPLGITVDDTDPAAVVVYVAHTGVKNSQSTARLTRFTFVPNSLPNSAIQNVTHWGENGWGDATPPLVGPYGLYWEETHQQLWVSGCFAYAGCDTHIGKFDRNGQRKGLYSQFGINTGDLVNPVAVVVDQQGIAYVADNASATTRIVSFRPLPPTPPQATIEHLSSTELAPGDLLTVNAAGQDGDDTNLIAAFELSTTTGLSMTVPNPQMNQTSLAITIPIIGDRTQRDKLGPGLHFLLLRVQGNEGDWSQWVNRTVYVAWRRPPTPDPLQTPTPTPNPDRTPLPPPANCPAGGLWTLLLYLDADNVKDGQQLFTAYHSSLEKLEKLNHACVQVAAQLDGGLTVADTERWLIRPHLPTEKQDQIAEQSMDTPAALAEFIRWGQKKLPADHYYLAIADHGNAYLGTAFDHTSDREKNQPLWTARLKASDLRNALNAPGVLPIDILHLDACSMALLDVAYDLRERVKVMIASQYIGWSFFAYADYASYIGQATNAKQLATLIVNRYGNLAEQYRLPYTLSALDLTRIEPVKNGIDLLAMRLKAWLNADANSDARHKQLFDEVRNRSIFFDSTTDMINSPRDAYVDLKDFVTRIKQAGHLFNADITGAADEVLNELGRSDGLFLAKRQSVLAKLPNGKDIGNDVSGAGGISLYYPVEGTAQLALPPDVSAAVALAVSEDYTYTQIYADYIDDKLFDFTRAARWDEFLQAAYGKPSAAIQLEPPPAPLAPLPPVNNTQVTLQQNYRLEDKDNNSPSAGDPLHFATEINNQSTVTLTNVVLVQSFDQPVQPVVRAAVFPCTETSTKQLCVPVADIAPMKIQPVNFTVALSSNTLPVSQAILYVKGKPFGEFVTPTVSQSLLYLPVVMKK